MCYLLKDILKDDWGFKGVVMSDWGGCITPDLAALNGLDMEMGIGHSVPEQLSRRAVPPGIAERPISRLRA